MALDVTGQSGWGGGIYRGRSAPPDSVYEATSALVDDEGNLFRRAGSEFFTAASAASSLVGLADLFLAPGRRLMAWGANTSLFALNEAAPAFVTASGVGDKPVPVARAVPLGPLAIFQSLGVPGEVLIYGGSLKAAAYLTGTVTVTAGSPTVTGSGTSWLANVDPGMLFVQTLTPLAIVQSVDSNTQLTLRDPWAGPSSSGGSYVLTSTVAQPPPASAAKLGASSVIPASVGSPARMVLCFNNRAYFTEPGSLVLSEDAFHELPASEVIIGADSFEDTLLLFTTGGVWAVQNMAFDPVDDAGNVQHIVSEVNKDLVLWGDAGIAARGTSLVIPGVDDLYLFNLSDGPTPIATGIRPLYRSYVRAGFQPGIAAVHRGHYFLPILQGTTWVDTLVVRLDREGTPVTRWAGHAAAKAYARRAAAGARSPQLFGVAGQRVTDLTGCFDPQASSASDADGTDHVCMIETRDYPTSATNHPGTVARVRLRYELVEAGSPDPDPQLLLGWSSAREGGVFEALNESGEEASGAQGGLPSAGDSYNWWHVGKQRERIRFRIFTSGACASFVLRTLELVIRQSGLR